MTAGGWIGLALLLALALLLLLRLGVLLEYDGQLQLSLCIGPYRRLLKKKEEQEPAKKETPPERTDGKAKKKKKPVITWELVLQLLTAVKKLLFMIGKRLHIIPLELRIVFGGPDPADVAQAYGKSHAALWPLLALLEEHMTVRRRQVQLDMDFEREKSVLQARVGISMHVFDWLAVLLVAAVKGLQLLLQYRRLQPPAASETTKESPQKSEA